jgi:hypothetical protein
MDYTATEPLREFARRRKLSPGTVYEWADKGLIDTFLIGARRHVVIGSYERLVQRLVAEQRAAQNEPGPRRASPNPKASNFAPGGHAPAEDDPR